MSSFASTNLSQHHGHLRSFGLAVEFDSDRKKNGAFKLTGDTGTIRYMAPEVALNQSYSETADVYSFGILLWQICKLELPYDGMTDEIVERKVVHCGGKKVQACAVEIYDGVSLTTCSATQDLPTVARQIAASTP